MKLLEGFLYLLNALRDEGRTPHHWEISEVVYDQLVAEQFIGAAPQINSRKTGLVYGIPIEIHTNIGKYDIRLIAANSDEESNL